MHAYMRACLCVCMHAFMHTCMQHMFVHVCMGVWVGIGGCVPEIVCPMSLCVCSLSICICVCNLSFCVSVYSIIELFIVLYCHLHVCSQYTLYGLLCHIFHKCVHILGILIMWLQERFRCVR